MPATDGWRPSDANDSGPGKGAPLAPSCEPLTVAHGVLPRTKQVPSADRMREAAILLERVAARLEALPARREIETLSGNLAAAGESFRNVRDEFRPDGLRRTVDQLEARMRRLEEQGEATLALIREAVGRSALAPSAAAAVSAADLVAVAPASALAEEDGPDGWIWARRSRPHQARPVADGETGARLFRGAEDGSGADGRPETPHTPLFHESPGDPPATARRSNLPARLWPDQPAFPLRLRPE